MKRQLLLTFCGLVLLALTLPASPAKAAVSVGVSINTGGHRGISLSFRSRPDMVLIPSSRVYYVQDYDRDVYCYDDNWYYVDDGYWYEAPSYRGPFVQISFSSVPYYVRSVPVSYRRHWGGSRSGSPSYGYRNNPSSDRYRGDVDRSQDKWWTPSQNRGNGNSNRGNGNWNRESRNQDREGRDRSRGRGNRRG